MVLLESHYRADWIRQRGDTDCLGSLVARALASPTVAVTPTQNDGEGRER
jgi:hypothetical protein